MVTDSAGKVLYSGPYNTPEEKEAVPEAVRERLKNHRNQLLLLTSS